ncbi:MAG: hypothetical protein RSF77_07025 [Oscillospiraceae bacterium]
MAEAKKVGPCRYLAAAKPLLKRGAVSIFSCSVCGGVFTGWEKGASAPIFTCCGKPTEKLKPRSAEELPKGARLYYDIVGGLNENCIRAFWEGEKPQWLFLSTFTGGQYLELGEKKRAPAVFALAGEDAYAYCDKDPCEMCSFRCKNGFVLYAYYKDLGLFELPLNQIAATQGTLTNRTNMPPHNQ